MSRHHPDVAKLPRFGHFFLGILSIWSMNRNVVVFLILHSDVSVFQRYDDDGVSTLKRRNKELKKKESF